MKLIIFVILFTFFSTWVTTQHELSTQVIMQPITNIERMLTGLDLKNGLTNMTTKNPVFSQYTYNSNRITTINGVSFACPDQIYALSDPGMAKKSTTSVFYTSEEVQESLFETFTTGFNCKRINGMFSLSEQVSTFDYAFSQQASYSALTNLIVTTYQAELNAEIRLNENFKTIADRLPNEYNTQTCSSFINFIRLFGTNFAYRVIYGGYVTMSSIFTMASSYDKSSTDISVEVGAQFLMFTSNTSVGWNDTTIGQTLDATYDSTLQLYGGYPSYYNPSNYQSWVGSVPKNPLFVRADVVPLSDLLVGLPQQDALYEAIVDYLGDGEIYMGCS